MVVKETKPKNGEVEVNDAMIEPHWSLWMLGGDVPLSPLLLPRYSTILNSREA